jgi:signal transduction histidine kinase
VIGRRLDEWFEDLYRRLGHRYLTVMRWSVVVPMYVASAIFAAVFIKYLETTPSQIVRSLLVGNLLFWLAITMYMAPRGKRLCEPVDTWLEQGRPDTGLMAAWEAARNLTMKGFWLSLRTALVLYLLILVYSVVEFSLDLVEVAVISQGYLKAVVGIVAVLWPFTEVYHRPVRRDLGRRLGDRRPGVDVQFPMGGRLLLTGAAIGIMTGAVASYAARADASIESLGRLGLLVMIVGITISLLPIFLLSRSLLAPVEDLVEATRRAGAGDLSTRADVTTNDEVGVLAHSFNQMLERLDGAVDEVRQSRARIIAASDAERRRIERNIHDGAQQQLTALALQLELLREQSRDHPVIDTGLAAAIERLRQALGELRELAQGLHPAVLSTDGLRPALEQLADRSAVPVSVRADADRYDDAVESTAYFVASEALANVAKYANAMNVSIDVHRWNGRVVLEVVDDGVGGAHVGQGSGLRGLVDRVEAVGGSLAIHSAPGGGTTIRAELPVDDPQASR